MGGIRYLIWFFICSCASDGPPSMNGRVYKQMAYNATGSALAQLAIRNKFVCAAQCAHRYPSCNTAIYDPSLVSQCLLYSEPVIQVNLIQSLNAMVYDFQQRKFRATTSTTTTSTSTTSTTTSTTATTTTVALSLYGVQFNLNPSSLPSGWSPCYTATYATAMSSSTISSILSSCNKNKLLLGCRVVGNATLTLAAVGDRSDVLYDCSSTSNCVRTANGVGWYFSNSYSWGFANGGDAVFRSSCDTESTNPDYRLCWHTNEGGGYRCGSTAGLNTDTTWEKVIYHAN